MTEPYYVLGFYKYVEISDAEELRDRLKAKCDLLNMKGSILLGSEGINASVSGTRGSLDSFKKYLDEQTDIGELFYKEEETTDHPYRKMKVKVRNEIVSFKHPVDLSQTGKHISAQELASLYDENGKLKEGVVILDARNDYEYEVGRFKDSIHLNIRYFRDFADKAKEIEHLKDKKVVMYCTGGIRCEKASAYLKSQGFSDVSQLNQGIIQYGKEDVSPVWEGKCFVFDNRRVSPINSEGEPVSNCMICDKACDFLRNCNNVKCNLFFVCCNECKAQLHGCCCEKCKEIYREDSQNKAKLKNVQSVSV